MKEVIITGATGFIGRHVLQELYANGLRIVVLVRKGSNNLTMIKCYAQEVSEWGFSDIYELREKLKGYDIDTIYHFAWQGVAGSEQNDVGIQFQNLKMTLSLLDLANELNIGAFITAGSLYEIEVMKELAEKRKNTKMNHMYTLSKLTAHNMAQKKASDYGIRLFWPVVTNAYGAGEFSDRLVNTIIRKLLCGEVPQVSLGEQLYDFIHIKDVARAMYYIGISGKVGRNYLIGSGNPRPLRSYLETIGRICNEYSDYKTQIGFGQWKKEIVFLDKKDLSTEELEEDLKFQCSITFEEGIRQAVIWQKENM